MQKSSRGVFGRAMPGFYRYLGPGPAMQVLVGSVAALAAGCGANDAPTPSVNETPVARALGTARAAIVTNTVLEVVGDTFVRQAFPNENHGGDNALSVQTNSRHRTILFFDTPALKAALANGTLVSARIDLFVGSNGGSWGAGRPIGIHSLRQPSAEGAATWSCAVDSDVGDQQPDCSGNNAWNMSATNANLPFASTPSSIATITNGTFGVVSFDVTADVLAIAAGTQPGHGWLIKKLDENATGSIQFVSREQGPAPRLTLAIDIPNLCTQTAADDVTCDGVDDDCDGSTDEDVGAVETTCGVGACASSGIQACSDGQLYNTCTPGTPADTDTSCDLVDDDCDGAVDDDYIPLATSCGVGACNATGQTSCVLGASVDGCQPGAPAPVDATCDLVDDDCDGSTDEDYAQLTTDCGVGACRASGSTSCVGGAVADSCTPGAAAASDASCDGVDDDCDGAADEEFAPTCAGQSTLTCVAGSLVTTPCADGNACNGDETCSGAAACNAGTPPEVDDNDPCTSDACDPVSGVTHALVAAGTACAPYSECNAGGQCVSLLPPDPSAVAPVLPVGTLPLLERVRFMFESAPLIQTGVAQDVFSVRRAAVLRGRVLGADGQPLPMVTVSVQGHPEYGKTLSRIDGWYDLVVNGGGTLTVSFARNDVLEAHRTLPVPWQDYESIDDVALFGRDGAVTQVGLPSAAPATHAANPAADARGARRARLFIPAGTSAVMTLADGSEAPVQALSLRATELGVGSTGSRALPASLPETAASVYAVELSADEAESAHALDVELSQAASLYVDNFLALPVGTNLPLGVYDRAEATWLGAPSGRVLELLAVSSGLAQLDVDGSGEPASGQDLAELGIGSEELGTIGHLYTPGQAFFRLPVERLAPFDIGLPFGVNEGTGGVAPKAPGQLAPLDDATITAAVAEGQVLAQSLPLSGTPFTLEYRSDRVLGSKRGQKVNISAMGASIPSGLTGGIVDVQIAGQRHVFAAPTTPSASIDFTWNGKDAAGRTLHGWQRADIRVGLVAPKSYLESETGVFAHTAYGGANLGPALEPAVRWLTYDRQLHTFDSRQTDIGAWSLNQHHQYDPKSRVVYLGSGGSYATRTTSTIIDRYAGTEQSTGTTGGDGGPRLAARLDTPRSVAVGPDGSAYIGTRRGVRRVDAATGIITMVAGGRDQSVCDPNLNDGPAAYMCIAARTVDFARDGSLVIADNSTVSSIIDRIRRLDLATGMITHVAGVRQTAGCANMGDGGPARDAAICNLTAHASAPDGSIYLLDRGSSTNPMAVRKISPDGIIDTVGTAEWPANDDAAALAVGPDGSVFIAQTRSVLRILPTGETSIIAGNPKLTGNTGEGGPAINARFGSGGPGGVSIGADGRLYIGDPGNGQVRMIDQLGIIRRVAGTTATSASGNGGPPLLASLGVGVLRSAMSPDGSMFVTSQANNTVRLVAPSIAGDFSGEAFVPSRDGTELYHFAADGRHLDTKHMPGATLMYSFGYDSSHRLVSVTDASGNMTRIERDSSGNPTRIIAPLGEETLLDTNADGYVSTFIAPNGDETELTYDSGGLLTERVDPSGTGHSYGYDADGRLITP